VARCGRTVEMADSGRPSGKWLRSQNQDKTL
jgi:hypothetical protein